MKKNATTRKAKAASRQPSLNFAASSEAEMIAETTSVASPATPSAPTERKAIAQGKKRSAAALGQESENAVSPEGAKEDGVWPVAALGDLAADERNAISPLAEQTRIVAEVERRLTVVEELEAVVSTNLQRATRLRQSILQKAFTGELTGAATCMDGLQVQRERR